MKVRMFEAFAGYGSQLLAMKRLQRDFPEDIQVESVGYAEINPVSIKAYVALHGDGIRNYGNICEIDWDTVPDFDLFTYSFPCTDISTAGRQRGLEEGSGTRSSLLWECTRSIEKKRPKYLLMENVKALEQEKFRGYLSRWCEMLVKFGYTSCQKILSAKDYGVPQHRERLFLFSVRGGEQFSFPRHQPLRIELKEALEYLPSENRYIAVEKANQLLELWKEFPRDGFVYDTNRELVLTAGGRFCRTFTCGGGGVTVKKYVLRIGQADSAILELDTMKMRRMTSRERFRLMGVEEEDIEKLMSVVTRTEARFLTGNSIVVDVLYHIFRQAFTRSKDETCEQTLFCENL